MYTFFYIILYHIRFDCVSFILLFISVFLLLAHARISAPHPRHEIVANQFLVETLIEQVANDTSLTSLLHLHTASVYSSCVAQFPNGIKPSESLSSALRIYLWPKQLFDRRDSPLR